MISAGSWWPNRPARVPKPWAAGLLAGLGVVLFSASALSVKAGATSWDARLFRLLNQVPPAAALFVLIGAQPFTGWLPETVRRDQWGFILTGPDTGKDWPLQRAPLLLETTTPGVFAVGDVRHGSMKRVASAVGDGSTAIRLIHDYLALAPPVRGGQ